VSLSFFVAGRPAPQGSKRHVGKGVMVESSKQVKPWRESIRWAALDQAHGPLNTEGPVSVRLLFVMPRPASAPKRSTPPAVKRPDIDKLVRAVLDALSSAGVWRDDSQVVELFATKRLAEVGASWTEARRGRR
jgi:crossover junction endodeoxyribonuclease RusA